MEPVKILWSGLTGRVGRLAMELSRNRSDVEIVAGLSRQDRNMQPCFYTSIFSSVHWHQYDEIRDKPYDNFGADVIVDFSNTAALEDVCELATHTHTPLVIGTSDSLKHHQKYLEVATAYAPIFHDDLLQIKAKSFVDECVGAIERGKIRDFTLYTDFYSGKQLRSRTSTAILKRLKKAAGQGIELHSMTIFPQGSPITGWKFGDITCETTGLDELVSDIFEIAKVMARKPIANGKVYTIDDLWPDLPH